MANENEDRVAARPRLEVAADSLFSVVVQLRSISATYQQVRVLRTAEEFPPGLGIELRIPDTIDDGTAHDILVPLADPEPESIPGLLNQALGFLGGQVVALWEQAHNITSDAIAHCQSAQAAAEAAAPQPGVVTVE